MYVKHRYFARACAVATAGVALGTWAVTAASASGGGSATIHHGVVGPVGFAAGPNTATPTSSRYFAGYQAAVPAGSATTAEASFTVPTVSACTATDTGIAPTAGVAENNYTSFSAAMVFTGCFNGTATYYPALIDNGTETNYPTSPFAAGDVVDVTTKVSHFRTRVQVTDVTTGVTQKIIGKGASASATVFFDEGWGSKTKRLWRVPDFGKLQFKNCFIDGKAIATWHPQAYQRETSFGTLQISTGALWSTGPAFTTRFVHS